jgi:hypothetical protein
MPKIAIIVEFETVPGRLAEVETLLREHARRTRESCDRWIEPRVRGSRTRSS